MIPSPAPPITPTESHRRGIDAIFSPRNVALIGASEDLGSVGRALLSNLSAFPGSFFAVNSRHSFLMGRRTYPDIASVPEQVELAIIATPAATVPGVVRECVKAGVSAAVIISAGFRECGETGLRLEEQVQREARRGGLRIIGPNCLGVMNPRTGLNATFARTLARPGTIAFLSQSGALCSAVLDWSRDEGVGFSAFASTGGLLDLGWGELIRYFGADPATSSILLYLESVGNAGSFLAAVRDVAPFKPIIVLKAGRTAAAAHAAASHTGALVGRDEVFDAALRRAGGLRVDSVVDLFSMAEVLASQPLPKGARLSIVTNAGGPGALATDALILGGGTLAALSPATKDALNDLLPAAWSHGNPIDVLGDARPSRFGRTVALTVADPGVDGVLAMLTPQAMTDATAIARELPDRMKGWSKPLLTCWMGGEAVREGRRILREAGVPTFSYPETAARAFNNLSRFAALRQALAGPNPARGIKQVPEAARWLGEIQRTGRTVLSEYESKTFLTLHGIPCVDTQVAFTEDEAVATAAHLGFPVAVKLHSHTITHKSEVNGVHLDLETEAAVRAAWKAIQGSVSVLPGGQHFLGVTVQPMIGHDGREMILGSNHDPQFGPVLLFGAGGKLVEIVQDYAVDLPPLDHRLAREVVARTKINRALQGIRGLPAVDFTALDRILVDFSQLVVATPEIKEIDLNPLVVSGNRLLVLDARVVLHATGNTTERRVPPALLCTDSVPT